MTIRRMSPDERAAGCPAATDDAAPASGFIPAGALRSEQLFRGRREVPIVHNGEAYRLRLTRLGKMILTK